LASNSAGFRFQILSRVQPRVFPTLKLVQTPMILYSFLTTYQFRRTPFPFQPPSMAQQLRSRQSADTLPD